MGLFSNEHMYESREKCDLWKRMTATTTVELRDRERTEGIREQHRNQPPRKPPLSTKSVRGHGPHGWRGPDDVRPLVSTSSTDVGVRLPFGVRDLVSTIRSLRSLLDHLGACGLDCPLASLPARPPGVQL